MSLTEGELREIERGTVPRPARTFDQLVNGTGLTPQEEMDQINNLVRTNEAARLGKQADAFAAKIREHEAALKPQVIRSGIWRHYKGHRYLVLGQAQHTETHEDLVIYVPLYEHSEGGSPLRARPAKEWLDRVSTVEGTLTPRFIFEGVELKAV